MCDTLLPQTIPCSDHGLCILNTCICNDGWTSSGDFAPIGGDCAILKSAILALAGLGVASNIVIILAYGRYLFLRISTLLSMYGSADITVPNIAFAINLFFSSIFGFLYDVLKLVNLDSYTIGQSYPSTIFLALCYGFFFQGLLLYLNVCLNFLSGFQRMMLLETRKLFQKNLATTTIRLRIMYVLNVILSILLFCTIFVPNEKQYIIGMTYYIGAGVFLCLYITSYSPMVFLVVSELGRTALAAPSPYEVANENDQVKQLYFILKYGSNFVSIVISLLVVTLLFTGSWQYLLLKVTYINTLFTFILASFVMLPLLFSVSNYSVKTKIRVVSRVLSLRASKNNLRNRDVLLPLSTSVRSGKVVPISEGNNIADQQNISLKESRGPPKISIYAHDDDQNLSFYLRGGTAEDLETSMNLPSQQATSNE